jgi:hypothetical protein
MSIQFDRDWLMHTMDHLTTEALARRLIRSAARSLANSTAVDVIVWRIAALGGSELLMVTKGLHQPEGALRDLMHLTMRLYIAGSRPGNLVPNTMFSSRFHLYIRILGPTPNQPGHRLQPTRLSYQTTDYAYNVGDDFIHTDIPNGDALSSDLSVRP